MYVHNVWSGLSASSNCREEYAGSRRKDVRNKKTPDHCRDHQMYRKFSCRHINAVSNSTAAYYVALPKCM